MRKIILSALLLNSAIALGHSWGDAASQDLASEIKQVLVAEAGEVAPGDLRVLIDRVDFAYAALPRNRVSTEDLLELRYLLQLWRSNTAKLAIQKALNTEDPELFDAWIADLHLLRVKVGKARLFELFEHGRGLGSQQVLLRFLADQGDSSVQSRVLAPIGDKELLKRSGPGRRLDFEPIHESGSSFDSWSGDPDQGRYEFVGEGVVYRGNVLLPGDMLLVELREDAPGLYTFFNQPRSLLSHFAFFTIVESHGNRLPVAVEIFEHGVRAVPLNVFLASRYTSYVEIYRFRDLPLERREWYARLRREVPVLWREPHAYGFDPATPDRKYLSCASVGTVILERTGVRPIEPKSEVNPAVRRNLKKLGFEVGRYLVPTDYMLDPRVELVGWVDNQQLRKNLIDALVIRRLSHMMATRELSMDRLPWSYGFYRWAITQVKAETPIGVLFRWFNGFTRENFPLGPASVLAFVDMIEGKVKTAIDNVAHKDDIQGYLTSDWLSIHDLEANEALSQALDRELAEVQSWFDLL